MSSRPMNWLESILSEAEKDYEKWPEWMKNSSRTGEYIRKEKSAAVSDETRNPPSRRRIEAAA
jgi:hypothetical protein